MKLLRRWTFLILGLVLVVVSFLSDGEFVVGSSAGLLRGPNDVGLVAGGCSTSTVSAPLPRQRHALPPFLE